MKRVVKSLVILFITNNDLKYATNSSGLWVTSTIDSTGGVRTSIGIDSNDIPHISYTAGTPGALKYATIQ